MGQAHDPLRLDANRRQFIQLFLFILAGFFGQILQQRQAVGWIFQPGNPSDEIAGKMDRIGVILTCRILHCPAGFGLLTASEIQQVGMLHRLMEQGLAGQHIHALGGGPLGRRAGQRGNHSGCRLAAIQQPGGSWPESHQRMGGKRLVQNHRIRTSDWCVTDINRIGAHTIALRSERMIVPCLRKGPMRQPSDR